MAFKSCTSPVLQNRDAPEWASRESNILGAQLHINTIRQSSYLETSRINAYQALL
uniref:Uncharacterized protein n=1 Tax=Zea mays TaxID=4577 RepID=C4IYX3_MAIZE|nr:unknown [Zea mays]